MTTQAEIDAIQSKCACVRIDARDCMWARSGMPIPLIGDPDYNDGFTEQCECPCHAEIDDSIHGDEP